MFRTLVGARAGAPAWRALRRVAGWSLLVLTAIVVARPVAAAATMASVPIPAAVCADDGMASASGLPEVGATTDCPGWAHFVGATGCLGCLACTSATGFLAAVVCLGTCIGCGAYLSGCLL